MRRLVRMDDFGGYLICAARVQIGARNPLDLEFPWTVAELGAVS